MTISNAPTASKPSLPCLALAPAASESPVLVRNLDRIRAPPLSEFGSVRRPAADPAGQFHRGRDVTSDLREGGYREGGVGAGARSALSSGGSTTGDSAAQRHASVAHARRGAALPLAVAYTGQTRAEEPRRRPARCPLAAGRGPSPGSEPVFAPGL